MYTFLPFLTLLCGASAAAIPTTQLQERAAAARTTPPAGCLTVGNGFSYSTLSAAVLALGSSTKAACIFVGAGTYTEQVTIKYSGALTVYGYTTDTGSYKKNAVTFIHSLSSTDAGSLDASSTINVVSANFKMYNINVVNGVGQGTQAVALTANADKLGFYGCSFSGYQDTLYAKFGRQYYSNCLVTGAVDYIFGDASAWFGECTIQSNGNGAITAQSRMTASDTTWYVFDHSTVQAAPGYTTVGSVYLGRPWRVLARVMYQNSVLSNIINAKGWTTMAAGATPLYYEYGNTGAGASTSQRMTESTISGPTTHETVLGSDYTTWVDTSY